MTPGPWRVIDLTDILALEGTPESIVVAATKFFEGEPTERQIADARLIAAAPELLNACRAAMWALTPHPIYSHAGNDMQRADDDNAFETLKAAIAKAEGQEP